MKHFAVIIIGGGHAGVEAAHASARMGCATALITHSFTKIGEMSCNPAIGGLGKGHLVREIDALDGLMGRVADRSGIQFRLLNRRKGPAVQGPRTQSDRKIYKQVMQQEMTKQKNLTIIEAEVKKLAIEKNRVVGVELKDGNIVAATNTVLTTGTFLNGVIHIGGQSFAGGRMDDPASVNLASQIGGLGLPVGRLKTGTPPRLAGRTIDWNALEGQEADTEPTLFSFLHKQAFLPQIKCGISFTNDKTHEIIRDNLQKSAMYSGNIQGVGPRYCPSIEDKVIRFAEKDSHQIFLEPEGLNTHTVYPNGISTSLPEDVQVRYVQSIKGLESVKIEQPGYAIEYDYIDPRALNRSLAVSALDGLYFAGQINGTTGYEEAAAQGLMAGLNAALNAQGKDQFILDRSDGYIGVMIDDLVTKGVREPYRMFTSRAEFRLSLRADNADQRLTEKGIQLGCVGPERAAAFKEKLGRLVKLSNDLKSLSMSPKDLSRHGINVSQDGKPRTAFSLLRLPEVDFDRLLQLFPKIGEADRETAQQVEKDALYSYYIERQQRDVHALKRDETKIIPTEVEYDNIVGLSHELREKLTHARPETLAQASRIDGMTPAALTLVLAQIRQIQLRKQKNAG